MEYYRQNMGTNYSISERQDNILKPLNSNVIKYFKPLKNVDDLMSNDSESIENNLSSMSINDETNIERYHMPEASNLTTKDQIQVYRNAVIARREVNRTEIQGKVDLDDFSEIMRNDDTGCTYALDMIDSCMKYDASYPLGMNFLEGTTITPLLREKAVFCLFRVCRKTGVDYATVSMGMMICDRYIKKKPTLSVPEYKQVMLVCWYLACKFELVQYPCLDVVCKLLHMTPGVDLQQQLYQLEGEILPAVDWVLSLTSVHTYLRALLFVRHETDKTYYLGRLLADLSTQSAALAGHDTSVLAAACYLLAMCMACRTSDLASQWPASLQYISGLSLADFKPVLAGVLSALLQLFADFDERRYLELKPANKKGLNRITEDVEKTVMEINTILNG